MTQKDTALSVVDTHAGAGLYRLDGDQARTSGEAASGIFSLVGERGLKATGMGSLIDDYLAVLREFNPPPKGAPGSEASKLRNYPGSPLITEKLLRPQDRAHVFEVHPTDQRLLRGLVAQRDSRRIMTLRVADGLPLSFTETPVPHGHAIEFRVNAENPYRDFIPSPGHVSFLKQPGGIGVRVDSHVYNGYDIPPHYDSMIGKIIVHADNRAEAIARMNRALNEFMIEGVHTTVPLGVALMSDARFQRGEYTTTFLEGFINEGFLSSESK